MTLKVAICVMLVCMLAVPAVQARELQQDCCAQCAAICGTGNGEHPTIECCCLYMMCICWQTNRKIKFKAVALPGLTFERRICMLRGSPTYTTSCSSSSTPGPLVEYCLLWGCLGSKPCAHSCMACKRPLRCRHGSGQSSAAASTEHAGQFRDNAAV